MIIWINGSFGVGKTSVAHRIVAQRPGTTLFDPEQIGFLLRRLLPAVQADDFQDLPLWRELTVRLVAEAASAGDVVVPMTLANRDYFEEIVGGLRLSAVELHHFTLTASADTVRRRLRRRLDWPASRRWTLSRVEGCVAALADAAFAVHVDAERRSVHAIAEEILASIEGERLRAA